MGMSGHSLQRRSFPCGQEWRAGALTVVAGPTLLSGIFQRDGPVAKSLFLNLDGSKAKKKSAKQILIIRAGLLF
jgi:hypothetical protein